MKLKINLQKSSRSIIMSESNHKSTSKKTVFRFGELKDQLEYLIENKYRESLTEMYDDDEDYIAPTKLTSM